MTLVTVMTVVTVVTVVTIVTVATVMTAVTVVTVVIVTFLDKNNLTPRQPMRFLRCRFLRFLQCFLYVHLKVFNKSYIKALLCALVCALVCTLVCAPICVLVQFWWLWLRTTQSCQQKALPSRRRRDPVEKDLQGHRQDFFCKQPPKLPGLRKKKK